MANTKRIYSLDVFKLLLAYTIALGHMGVNLTMTDGTSVEIFFMLSGFFLGRRFYRDSYENASAPTAWDYTLQHAKSIYPHYLFSLAVFFCYLLARSLVHLAAAPDWAQVVAIIRDFYNQVPDLVFLHSSFRFHESINYPTWQISALLIAGYFLYALLCWNEPLTRRILLPVSILMERSLIYSGVDLFANFGPVYLPLLRAFSAMSVGILAWYGWMHYGDRPIQGHSTATNITSLFFLVCIPLFGNLGSICWIAAPFLILICQWDGAWINKALNRPCFRFCGDWSLAIYLNHAFVERIVKALILPRMEAAGMPLNQWQSAALFLLLLTPYSMFTAALVKKLQKKTALREVL